MNKASDIKNNDEFLNDNNKNNLLKENEKFEDLQLDGLKIIQNKDLYRFTSDAVILSNFVNAKPKDFLIDLGTGSGIIAILVAYKNKLRKVLGVEIQPELVDMANRSVIFNKLDEVIKIINCDIKQLNLLSKKRELNINQADIIVCNPPYKKFGSAILNQNRNKSIARHELTINMDEIIKVVKNLLKFGGSFYVVYDSNRTAELIFNLKLNGLEPKKLFFTQPDLNSSATLVFIEAVKGGNETLKILPVLITNDKDGKYLDEIKKMKFE